ncbi:uridine kinase [Longimicrobium terrae]|uniref:Uridine kinase n=1 Tax=Longimicrobium terrae TaxID=1639882 RepID=A0A841GV96_9BACT|nr:uridine kinase [Longimicrobium terrae]MBB4634889.1 uridine kinase [Longimicrobium terrae]MBB6069284.1 uridine kinase [Longimicrobium terrae]NNC31907.1 uridine kinase [Longimicrobium terrae]
MKPFLIGIAGGTGSGKTTVARRIYDSLHLDAAVFLDHDSYYKDLLHLSLEERAGVNFDHPDSLDNELLIHHLTELMDGREIEKPVYDFSRHTRAPEKIRTVPRDVILVDGILLFAEPRLREMFDLRIFVDTDADVRFIRRMRRDIEDRGRTLDSVIEQYLTTVRPMHFEFVEPTKRYADVIIPRGGQNRAGIDVVAARIRERLAEKARMEVQPPA